MKAKKEFATVLAQYTLKTNMLRDRGILTADEATSRINQYAANAPFAFAARITAAGVAAAATVPWPKQSRTSWNNLAIQFDLINRTMSGVVANFAAQDIATQAATLFAPADVTSLAAAFNLTVV